MFCRTSLGSVSLGASAERLSPARECHQVLFGSYESRGLIAVANPSDIEAQIARAKKLASQGHHPQARAVFSEIIETSSDFRARNEFGCYLLQLEQFDEAKAQFLRLLNDARKHSNKRLTSVACHNLAALYRAVGEFRLAAKWQQAADSTEDELVSGLSLCESLSARGCDAIGSGDYELAEELLWRSLRAGEETADCPNQAADWGNLAVLAGLRGEIPTAIRYLIRAYRINSENRDYFWMGCDLINLAECLLQVRKRRTALRFLQDAIDCFERSGAESSRNRAIDRWTEIQQVEDVYQRDPLLN